jgi:hypothetical protein
VNKLAALALVFLLVTPAVMAAIYVKPQDIRFREGGVNRLSEYLYDPRIQYKKLDTWVYLNPPQPPIFARGYPPYYPRGTARIESTRSAYKPAGNVILTVKDLRPSTDDNTLYQVWLYDSDSGYMLSLGQFEALGGGVGDLHYIGTQYYDAYEYIIVTREPRNDPDPRPSNDEVLVGKIEQKRYYEPQPVLGARASYGYAYYNE